MAESKIIIIFFIQAHLRSLELGPQEKKSQYKRTLSHPFAPPRAHAAFLPIQAVS